MDGLKAENRGGALEVAWRGEHGEELRAAFAIRGGQPTVTELAVRKNGRWLSLASSLQPEFHVTSGKRRMSMAQAAEFKLLRMDVTPELYDREKWYTFWHAPLVVPGVPGKGDSYPLPRDPSEVRRASATSHSTNCRVSGDGARLTIIFDGLEMGILRVTCNTRSIAARICRAKRPSPRPINPTSPTFIKPACKVSTSRRIR